MTNPVKKIIKQAMQYLAAHFGPHTRTHAEPKLLILMYHRVLPGNDARVQFEEPGMYVSPESFRDNLRILTDYVEFVSLAEWVEKKQTNQPLPDSACAITFDDGWADNYEFAFPILQELNIPATIFLVSDMIGTREMFWPEKLARLSHEVCLHHAPLWSEPALDWLRTEHTDFSYSNTVPTTEQLTQIIAHAKQYTDQDIHNRIHEIEDAFNIHIRSPNAALLNWEQVSEMTSSKLVDMGSHTCRHIRLNNLTPDNVLENEIINSRRTIESKTGQAVRSFCFPNGDYSSSALDLVKEQYSVTVTTEEGWNSISSNMHVLKRIGIHEDVARNKTAFLARISGWM